jgi:thiamine-monophosphate kinase
MPHEFELIDWIRRQELPHPRIRRGIGDDAAVVRWPDPSDLLITVDMLMDGVDFRVGETDPERIGRKALAVNLSDIAAMAGWPVAAVVSVALPRRGGETLAHGLQDGLQELATRFDVALAGGDTNTWDGPLVISVTVIGEAIGKGPVLRSGAQPGDWIMATGSFGGSVLGKHLDFTPRITEALALNQFVDLHAMIDVSDGLAADLRHILDESHVGAVLDAEKIPIAPEAHALPNERSPLEHALGDGEDFELLFTVSSADGAKLLATPLFEVPVWRIGEITAEPGLRLKDAQGNLTPAPDVGWKHGFE